MSIAAARSNNLAPNRYSSEPKVALPAATSGGEGRDTHPRPAAVALSLPRRLDSPAYSPNAPRHIPSLLTAWNIAVEEEADRARQSSSDSPNASPSPAPRVRQQRRDLNRQRLPPLARGSSPKISSASWRDQSLVPNQNSIFKANKIGPRIAATGENLALRTSGRESQTDIRSSSRGIVETQPKPDWLRRPDSANADYIASDVRQTANALQNLIARESMYTTEAAAMRPDSRAASADRDVESPNRSYAWELEQDFTEDFVASESPMMRPHSDHYNQMEYQPPNPKSNVVDLSRERQDAKASQLPVLRGSPIRRSNTRLDEIRAREQAVAQTTPAWEGFQLKPRNLKLQEIQQRESEGLSKRVLSNIRLGEIKDLNARARAHSPPEKARHPRTEASAHSPQEQPSAETPRRLRPPELLSTEAFPAVDHSLAPNAQIPERWKPAGNRFADSVNGCDPDAEHPEGSVILKQFESADSYGFPKQLAGTASNSPPVNPSRRMESTAEVETEASMAIQNTASPPPLSNNRASRKNLAKESKDAEAPKTSVSFTGLRPRRSMEAARDKRSSMPNSDSDPTERIEGEMKLFAPADNHSEKGSIREPSPSRDDSDDDPHRLDDTPRPPKMDSVIKSTPKIVGEFIHTPASVMARPSERHASDDESWLQRPISHSAMPQPSGPAIGVASDPETRKTRGGASSMAPTTTRRARSLSHRQRPLINSANPPTVQNDLMELRRRHQIEDSTLEDFDAIFVQTPPVSIEQQPPHFQHEPFPDTTSVEQAVKEDFRPERDLTTDQEIGKIGRSLPAVLSSIRDVKLGIERLRGDVFVPHAQGSASTVDPKLNIKRDENRERLDLDNRPFASRSRSPPLLPIVSPAPSDTPVAYVSLPIPRIFTRKPKLRLTFLGLFLALLSSWYTTETILCAAYCRPSVCTPSTACDWSFHDPVWGLALPVKLDEWLLHSNGQRLLHKVTQDAQDLLADLWDVLNARDITQVDQNLLDFHQRRNLSRRLRKRGLKPKRLETSDQKAKWDSWRATRLAREKASRRMEEVGEPG